LLLEADHWLDGAEISPDGRWLAYVSNQTEEWEVYLAPFRRGGRPLRVSTAGGRQPQWRGDSRELFFVTGSGELMAVELEEVDGELAVGEPRRLFTAGVSSPTHDHYAVTRDGERFLVMTPAEGSGARLKVLLNWQSLLE
jgi:hypothetical protein